MNTKSITRVGCMAMAFFAHTAFSQPGVQCGTSTIAPGASGTVSCNYLGTGSTAVGGQLTIGIGNADVTVDSYTCAAGFICPASGDPANIGFADFGLQEFQDTADAIMVNVTVAAGAAAPQMIPVVISNEAYADAANAPVAASGTVNGTISVADGPGPGILNVQPATLSLAADVNAAAGTGTITVSNDGVAGDATITPSCSLGTITGMGSITVSAAPASLAPGASGTVTASCSGAAEGTSTADYTCTATSSGTPSVTNDTTAISCVIASGTPAPNPVAGSTVAVNVGPVIRGSTGVGRVTFSETNNSGGAYDVTCAITDDGAGAFTINGGATATVSAAAPFTFAVNGTSSAMDPQPTGSATCTYSGGATGAVTVTLGIALIPEIVPTMTEWGLIILTLALVGFGAFQLRRRAPLA